MGTRTSLRIPFSLHKHYLAPLRRLLTDRASYERAYDPVRFFDQFHGLSESSDSRVTISPDFPDLDAHFHYNLVENGIIDLLRGHGLAPRRVLDIGSGTGHWVDFYRRVLRAEEVHAVDLSAVAVEKLRGRFAGDPGIRIHHGSVTGLDAGAIPPLDLVNAIGVLFHIVDDGEWERTLQWCHDQLRPGGALLLSGLLGWVSANVQFEPARFDSLEEYRGSGALECNKRVRSARRWRRTLRRCGFRELVLRRSEVPPHLHTPENHLLLAIK